MKYSYQQRALDRATARRNARREGKPKPQHKSSFTPGQIAHGIAGIAKAITGTGGTAKDMVSARTAICAPCPNAQTLAGILTRCRLCKCATWAKIRNANEKCPANKWGPATPANDFFARSIVISLTRTPERLERFHKEFPADWPFAWPQVFEAIDGTKSNAPDGWNWHDSNRGAVGCWQSWRAILKDAIDSGIDRPILVMEDDCGFVEGASQTISTAIAALPDDWELLFIGGQHNTTPIPVSPGIVRVTDTGRTHCMAIHPRFFQFLYDFWGDCCWHVDRCLQKIASERKFYAIDPWVAFQAANFSTLRNRQEPDRAWDGRVKFPGAVQGADTFRHSDAGDIVKARLGLAQPITPA